MNADRRAEIDDLFERLPTLSHYQLLGLRSYASESEIRKAYFAFSKQYHPDTLFDKELSAYKAKMEAIFARMTEAYDTLSNPDTRFEYDQTLRTTPKIQFQCEPGTVGHPSGEVVKKPIDRDAVAKRAAGRIRRAAAPISTPAESATKSVVRGLVQSIKNVKK